MVDEGAVEGVRARRLPVVERQRAAADLDERGAGAADDLAGVGPVGTLAADGERRAFHEERAADVLDRALDERAAQVAELLAEAVEFDRRAGLDDDGSGDDRVEVAGGREGVGDVQGKQALVHTDVTLQDGRGGERDGARAELRQDVGERVGGIVAGVRERDAEGGDTRRVGVEAERVGAELERRAGGAREVGARVEDDAREAQGAGRRGADAQGASGEVDALIGDERVDGAVGGKDGSRAARVEDLRGAGGEIEGARGAVGRGDDAARGVAGVSRGRRGARALDDGPRTDEAVDERGRGGEDDPLVGRAAEVGGHALERQGGVTRTGQRSEGERGRLSARVDDDGGVAAVDGQGAGGRGGVGRAGGVDETERTVGDGEGGVDAEGAAGGDGAADQFAFRDGDGAGERVARGRGEDDATRADLGEAAGAGDRAGEGDFAADGRGDGDPARQRERAGEQLRARVEAAERLGAAAGGVLEAAGERACARGEDLGERVAAELDRRGAVAEGGVVAGDHVTVGDGRAAGVGVGAVEPEHALLVLAEGERRAGDDAVDRDQAAARAQVDAAVEHDGSQLETVAVEAVEKQGAVAAASGGVGAGVPDGDRRQDHDAVLVAGRARAGDEDAVGVVVAAGGDDAGIGQDEGRRAVETEFQTRRTVAVGRQVDAGGSEARGAGVAQDEPALLDQGVAVVEVVGVEDEHAAVALAQHLRAGAAAVDDAVDRDDPVGAGVGVVVADVEIEVARRAEVRRDDPVDDEVGPVAAVRAEVQDTVVVGVAVADDDRAQGDGDEAAAAEGVGADRAGGGGDVETAEAILGVRAAEEPDGRREAQFAGAEEDRRGAGGAERTVDARLEDAALTEGDASGEALGLRDVDDAVGVIAIVLVGVADDQREGAAQDVGAGDGERAAGVAVATEAEGGRGAAGGRKGRAGEGGVAEIGAEPGFDVRRRRADLRHEVRLEIIQPAERDRDASGLAALVVGDQEIEAAAEQVSAGAGERAERDACARAVTRTQGERRRGVVVDVLEDDQLVGADVGGRFDAQAPSLADLDVAADHVGAGAARAAEPQFAIVDLRASGVALRTGEPEDAAAAADEGAVGDVARDEADRAAGGGGGVAVEAEVALLAAEVQTVGERDGVRGVAAVEGEDARIEERTAPLDRLAGAAEIDADGRAVGAEARAGAAGETHLTGARAQRTQEIAVRLIDGLLRHGTREHEVGRGKGRRGRARADDVAQGAFVEDRGAGVGRGREERRDARGGLDVGDRIRAVVGDDGGDRTGVPGEIVEMVVAFRTCGQEGDVDRMRAATGQQATGSDDEGRIRGAGQGADVRPLEIKRADRRRARTEDDVAGGHLDVLRRRPGADRRVDGVIGRDHRGVAEAAGRRGEVFQELGVGVGPAADERDVGGEAAVDDLVAGAEADVGGGRTVTRKEERRRGIGPGDGGEADRAHDRSAGVVALVDQRLAADQGQRAEDFAPVDGVLSGGAIVEGVVLDADTRASGDDRRDVAETVLLGGSAEREQHLQGRVAEVEPGDGLIRVRAAGRVAVVGADLAEEGGDRTGVGRSVALEAQSADAVVDERIGAEHAGGRTEADEIGTARGQRGVEVPDAVEVERTGHVGLDPRGGDQIDVAVHVGAVGAHHQAERAVAALAAAGQAEVLDERDGPAAGVDRAQAQGGAACDSRSRRTKHTELVVSVGLSGQKQHAAEDGSLALVSVMSAEHQQSRALLGEAADARDAAADIEDAGQIESRGRAELQAGSHGRARAGGLRHRGRSAGECERVVGEGRQADGAEMQTSHRERSPEIDQAARADERGRVSVGIVPGDVGGTVEPLRLGGAPDTGATQSGARRQAVTGGGGITIPVQIGGLRLR